MADSKSDHAKNGIIKHMNSGHTDSLIRYLEYYHKLSGWRAYNAQMTDIDLNGFSVKASGKVYRIPFHPAMESFSEARQRLVDMDKLSALYLKKSDITVKRFVPPYGAYAIGFLVTVGGLAALSQRWLFAPGGPVEREVGGRLGGQIGQQFAKVIYDIQPRLFYGVIAVHAMEVLYFARYTLTTHSVSARTTQFWLWAASVMIEGIGAQSRFKETVRLARIEKEKQKH